MTESSRRKAKSWPYSRHNDFQEILQNSNKEWFEKRQYSVNPRLPYLLDSRDDWGKNIILPEVVQYIEAEQKLRKIERKGFPLHKYLHHGLSSQAMLFNLIGPLIVTENPVPLKQAFEDAGIFWPPKGAIPVFEVEDRTIFNEDSGQPTSIDLVIKGGDNICSLFIEAKLVEHEFGGCSVFQGGDCDGCSPVHGFNRCYLHYIGRMYWTLLYKHGFLSGLFGSSPICPLAQYYQFFRELIFAIESGGDFVLLHDERNPAFYRDGPAGERGLMPFLITFVPQELRSRIHSVTIQQVVGTFKSYGDFSWLTEFEKKYALV